MVNMKGIKTFLHDAKAVSPAIATLILIVIAAVAAAGVGILVQSSQKNAQDQTANKDMSVMGTITTKGSTTILPISQAGAAAFMKKYPAVDLQVGAGGSAYGRMVLYTKQVDIGASSDPWPVDSKVTNGITVPGRKTVIIQDAGADASIWETKIGTGMLTVAANIPNGTSDLNINIVNASGPVENLITTSGPIVIKFDTLRAAYNGTGNITINDGTADHIMTVVDRSDPGGSEEVFAKWIALVDGTTGQLPTNSAVHGEQGNQGIRDYISGHQYTLGFVDIGYTNGQVNGKANVIAAKMDGQKASSDAGVYGLTGTYATASQRVNKVYSTDPLARDLYYYNQGIPVGAVKAYLDFITSAEGQKIVQNEGFFVN